MLARNNAACVLARHVRNLTDDSCELLGKATFYQNLRHLGTLAAAAITEQTPDGHSCKKSHNANISDVATGIPRKVEDVILHKPPSIGMMPMFFSNGQNQDLHRFLEEVGTNPKEARYWLKQFRHKSHNNDKKIFAVVQVDESVLQDEEVLESLASSLAFLQRNNMSCVLVHGHDLRHDSALTESSLKERRIKMTKRTMDLVLLLEKHGAPARPIFAGSDLIQAKPSQSHHSLGMLEGISMDAMKWFQTTDHIPVLPCIGETSAGQLLEVNLTDVTSEIARMMKPLKVMWLNRRGGFKDEHGDVIANMNFPADIESISKKSWCSPEMKEKMEYISDLLNDLPQESSVVITSANNILSELFSHHGSGTFFKITEHLLRFHSLDQIDTKRLHVLLNRSFGRNLKPDYFEKLKSKLHTIYISENYNAAAIITQEEGCKHMYLDKFAVSHAKQGEGFADLIWASIRQDFKSLFWRSKSSNMVNSWYFKRSEGSWSNGKWIVFWYGVETHRESADLVEHALDLMQSFGDPARERKLSGSSEQLAQI